MVNQKKRPNILWISIEDTSPRFGCYGDNLAHTPNIDKLASQGRTYTNAFSTSGVCAPSRSSIITGMYQTAIGTHHMRTAHQNKYTPELPTPYEAVPPAYVKTFTEYLRTEGYFCTNNFKTDYQFEPPLSAWDENGHHAHWRHRETNQPFFSVFNPMLTHESSMWADWIRNSHYSESDKLKFEITDPEKVEVPPYLPDTPKTREAIATQYNRIAEVDAQVGLILNELEEDGLVENTIVFLWSDHGEGLPRAKRWPYDAGIRVPLIVRWPGVIEEDQTSEQMVSMIDLGPTVLSITESMKPYHLQGRPFLGEEMEEREYIFATRDRHDQAYDKVRAVRDKRFKYIRNYYPEKPYLLWTSFSHHHPAFQELWRLALKNELNQQQMLFMQTKRPPEELYDCENDPFELKNLAKDQAYQRELNRLRYVLDEWCNKYDTWGNVTEEQMVLQMWPNGVQPTTASPIFIAINSQEFGFEPTDSKKFKEPTAISLHSATEGASIIYTLEETEHPKWKLYTGPIQLSHSSTIIRAKAVRIGYKDSEEVKGIFEIDSEKA
ncbi:sulfatase-like hydrolase/transferase [Gracilibacillus suaedae]|uniref:sulfatase-like hydrolase/transferase n=1 Tax=Gracilibacillus suaedae TaxID=2820273 RepID=UPI001ABE8A4A|nr:sulfatase-like hydrolase/transferase [Gracilibacillus suaedae]